MGNGPERGNTRIERLLREEAMMVQRGYRVSVTAVKTGCVRTIAVRGSTLMFGTRAWDTVRLGHWLCIYVSQGCLLRRSRSFAEESPRLSAEGLKYKLTRYPRRLHNVCDYSRFVHPRIFVPRVDLMNTESWNFAHNPSRTSNELTLEFMLRTILL